MKRLFILGILMAVLLVAECYPVQDLADQKARIQKSTTDSGGGVQVQRRDKPEDLLKLVMTADALHSGPQNRTKLPLQTKKPASVNNGETSELLQEINHLLSKEQAAKEFEVPKHVKDTEDLFEGDVKLTPEQKAILQSDDATIENWRRAAQK